MKIVCFHLNQVGDMVFSLPALRSLRDGYPQAHITSVVRPGQVDVLRSAGLADEVLPRAGGLNCRKLGLARLLSSRRFDMAVVFSQSAECALLAYLSRAPKRIGFVDTSFGMLLTQRVDFTHPPSIENNLRLVSAVGCEAAAGDYSGMLTPSPEQVRRADSLLAENGIGPDDPIVVLAPGTSSRRDVKEWTEDGFAAVGRYSIARGLRVVLLGTEPSEGISRGCAGMVDLGGKTSLAEVLGVVARCRALVGVDSGILHLCAATGTKVVGLYGPSNPKVTGPRGEGHVVVTSGADCSPCVRTECKVSRKCMTELDPSAVIAALETVLAD